MGMPEVTPEHLCLALIKSKKTSGLRVLEALNVDATVVRAECLRRIKGDANLMPRATAKAAVRCLQSAVVALCFVPVAKYTHMAVQGGASSCIDALALHMLRRADPKSWCTNCYAFCRRVWVVQAPKKPSLKHSAMTSLHKLLPATLIQCAP